MSIVRIEEEIQPLKYLVITQTKDPESVITTNVVISDNRLNKINLLSIEKGIQGDVGLQGPPGLPGKDGVVFDVLPISSGGTNNTAYNSGNIIYFDGDKLASSNYSVDSLLGIINSSSAITGIVNSSGLYKNNINSNAIELGVNIGDGLTINNNNTIIVDDTIVRKVELSIGNISGVVPIGKGGTNNQSFTSNRLLYFDGSRISSFPLATGRILLSGTTIDIIAGSGLTGGGTLGLPSGSVVLNIGSSSDILVETNSIKLSNTGTPGIYTKVTTDDKGRVIEGSNLTTNDIINILGYTPWNPNNDGANSGLDADKLDGFDSTDFFNLANHTGILNPDTLPTQTTGGTFTKVIVNDKGIVINGSDALYGDIVNSLGYRPVSTQGDTINGPVTINGDVTVNTDNLNISDNLITIGTNSPAILPSEPRGFSFLYGGATPRTGLLAYFPGDRELRLITNITSSTSLLDGGNSNDIFNEDIDGGDATTIYVYNNISGDAGTVLMRQLADNLYVSRTAAQIISGVKTFADRLVVDESISIRQRFGQSTPPLSVGSNNRWIENLNSDLLDDQHGSYYLNASNMTGLFNYEKVTFNNLEGTPNYVPIFDNRTTNPSRTISNSNILQSGNSIRIIADSNLFVGSSNSGTSASRSVLIGNQNKGYSNNSLAVGTNNIVSGNNSVALNNASRAIKDTSIAAGNYGYTWSNNQLAFGAFIENDDSQTVSQGQYSTIALGLPSTQTEGSFVSMVPSVILPKNKTVAYSLEVLLNKSAGTGAALFVFDSGIIKNTTYRDPDNLTSIKNITSVLKSTKKEEIYNDSQQRRHFYHYAFNDAQTIQNLDVTAQPLKYNPLLVQNVDSLYKYTPEYSSLSGTYYKSHDGELILQLDKPTSSGWFVQNLNDDRIYVKSYNHGMTSGSIAKLNFSSGSIYKPLLSQYRVVNSIDKNNFYVNNYSWDAMVSGNMIIIQPSSLVFNNSVEKLRFSGSIVTNGNQIYSIDRNIRGTLFSGMRIKYGPDVNSAINLEQTGVITAVSGPDVSFSPAFTGTINGNNILGAGYCEVIDFSKYIFDVNSKIRIDLGSYGYHSVTITTPPYYTSFCDQPTLAFHISGLVSSFTGINAKVTPASLNSGLLSVVPHRSVSGTYTRNATLYKKYNGIYTRDPSVSGISSIRLFNKNLEPVALPSAPFNYSFACGYGDTDNGDFEIYKSGLNSYLKFKNNGISIQRTGNQPRQFFTNSSNNLLNNSYIFFPAYVNDIITIPSGFEPDITYYPVNILASGSQNYFDLSLSSGGNPVSANLTNNHSHILFPLILNPSIKNTYNIRLKTFDRSGRFHEKPFLIHVDNTEVRTHVRNSIPDQYASVDDLFLFQVAANTFPTGSISGYVATTIDGSVIPSWLNFNTSTAAFSGTPTSGDIRSWDIIVRATGELLSVSDIFKLSVTNGEVNTSSYFSDPYQSFDIIDFNLSNISVPKNLSYNTTVGKITTNGGYNPYLIFETASNTFRGNAHSGSRIITETEDTSYNFATTTLTSNLLYLESGNIINCSYTNTNDAGSNKVFYKAIPPAAFDVVYTSGQTHLTSTGNIDLLANNITSGNRLFSDQLGWNNQTKVVAVTQNQISLDRIPITLDSGSLSLSVYTSGYNILLNESINLSGNIKGQFNSLINNFGNYYIDNLQYYSTTGVSTEWCPNTIVNNENIKGFETNSSPYLFPTTGYYATGTVSFYTDLGSSEITVYPDTELNLESTEDSIYINFITTNTGIKPQSRDYANISGVFNTSFMIENNYLFPNVQKLSTGLLSIDLDKNHSFKILDSGMLNQIPIKFDSAAINNANRIPKNNLFDIVSISGNTIKVDDFNNYLLKEYNQPDYFEQPIQATYETNGFSFSGLLSSGSPIIFNCTNFENISGLEPNMSIGSNYNNWNKQSSFVRSQDTLVFTVTATSGSNRLSVSPSSLIPSLVTNIQIFSEDSFWSNIGYRSLISSQANSGWVWIDDNLTSFSGTRSFDVYTKPYIQLSQKVCLLSQQQRYERLYFNGNILKLSDLSTPRSYLQNNDQIKILNWNNNNNFDNSGISRHAQILSQNDRQTTITGIAINGNKDIPPKNIPNISLKENQYRYSDPLGLSRTQELPSTGLLSFVGSVSGYCTIPVANNIYYHTHGGSTATWPADTSGVYVVPPKTGIYTISNNSATCGSGYLCIKISGFKNTIFDNILDIITRPTLGKNPTSFYGDNVSGSIKPLALQNKRFYFDFSDDLPEINGSYYVSEKINPSVITLNIPYNANYLNKSGLVYMIDSDSNIKSNKNPNIDNVLTNINGNLAIKIGNTTVNNYVNYYINSYNYGSKRWKHLVNLNKNINNYGGYTATFGGQIDSKLISLSPETIKIFSTQYSFDSGLSYSVLDSETNTIDLLSTNKQIYIKFFLRDGAGKWDSDIKKCAPRINIYGIGDYSIDSDNIIFDNTNQEWQIVVILNNLNHLYNHRPLTVRVSDESGFVEKILYIDSVILPKISIPSNRFVLQNDPNGWVLPFDIKNLPDPNDIVVSLSGHPGSSYSSVADINSTGIKIFTGPVGNITGVFNPVITIKDYVTNETLASQTGSITVLSLNDDLPYNINLEDLSDNTNLNLGPYYGNNTASFQFHIPAISDTETDLSVTFDSSNFYGINPIIEYNAVSRRYRITAVVTGVPGYYPNKNINIGISQPQYDANDELYWQRYTLSKAINLTLYRDIEINVNELNQPVLFNTEEPWSLNFKIDNGLLSHRSDESPRVKISNLTNIGNYESQPLEYNLQSTYDNTNKKWNFNITSKRDIFGEYTRTTGIHTLKIYAEDNDTFATGYIRLNFTQIPYLDNLRNTIYSTPNNQYVSSVDVKQFPYVPNQSPTVTFPGNLKENTITLSRHYNKYDNYFQLWEYGYSGSAIFDKWDVGVNVTNVNNLLSDNQYSNIVVSCKGIATDKIQAVAKLNLIELDSNSITSFPLQITNLTTPSYQTTEGSAWAISFSTIGGLENPNYPPTIILSGMPSACSGYNPKLPLIQQNSCLKSRGWNANAKRWDFEFEGLPLCGQQGLKPFIVTAIDTDTTQNLYLDVDSKTSAIEYISLEAAGIQHPKPQIIDGPNQEPEDPIPLTPLCNTSISKTFRFGIRNRTQCPIPTGLTGWMVSGSLPSGLDYLINFPGVLAPPWNNLSSGTLTLFGEPLAFASGGLYNEKFYLTVFDARNNSTTKEFKFIDTSTSNPPSPISYTIYFESNDPAYTSRVDRQSNQPVGTVNLSGTAPIDYNRYSNIYAYKPAPHPSSLLCTSRLPHNQCLRSVFMYSGGNYMAGDSKVFINNTKYGLAANDIVYFEFDGDINHINNGQYTIKVLSNQSYVDIIGHNFNTGSGILVRSIYDNSIFSKNLHRFNGSVDTISSNGILGCGSFKYKNNIANDDGYGIFGRLRPSHKAHIPTSGVFNAGDTKLSGLILSPIPEYSSYPSTYTIKTSTCWESGYYRVSGIVLPRPSVELTDPPPAASFAPFSYNNQAYSVLSRVVYGNSEYEKNQPENYRAVGVNYKLQNTISNSTILQGSVNTSLVGGNSQAIVFNNSLSSGSVLSIRLWNNPDIFPTYIYTSIPYIENEYFWIHKGGDRDDTPTQASFPPIIATGIGNNINVLSGVPISGYGLRCIGGYIPWSGNYQASPYYALSDNTPWNLSNYSPIISGIVQKDLNKVIDATYSYTPGQNSTGIIVNIASGVFNPNDHIYISFKDNLIPPTGLTLPVNYTNVVILPRFPSAQQTINGVVTIEGKSVINNIVNNQIFIEHNNINYNIGDKIDIGLNKITSTENRALYSTDKLSIVSGDANILVAETTDITPSILYSGLSIGNRCYVRKNIYNQINISSPSYTNEGQWSVSLTGTPTNLYKDYIYKIITSENTGLPVFSGTSLHPKTYAIEYPLYINKSPSIILSQSILDNGITKTNGAWSFSFEIEGGQRPVLDYLPEITLDDSFCSFTRVLSTGMRDSYNPISDRLIVTLNSTNNVNHNWSEATQAVLQISDKTGSDTTTIYFS